MSKRHGSDIKQLSAAIGMARKQSYSFYGREVDVVWWSVAAKPRLKICSHIQQQCGSSAVESSWIYIVTSQKNMAGIL